MNNLKTVKTYHQVNPKNESASFSVSKMEDIYSRKNGEVDEPHRHDYYTLLVIKEAKGIHKIDFNEYELAQQQIYFVAPGQVHQLIENRKSKGFVFTFSNQFLIENSIKLSFIESLSLFENYGQSPPLLPNEDQFIKILRFTEEIYSLDNGNAKMKELSIGSFLKLLLIECNNVCAINPLESYGEQTGNNIIREFRKKVNAEYKNEHSTSFYANHLNISPDHLNRIIKSKIGKTAKEYIQTRIITEAKRLLFFSDLSNKEIGFELGFNEPSNFSAFFKKCTQLSPSNFKKREG